MNDARTVGAPDEDRGESRTTMRSCSKRHHATSLACIVIIVAATGCGSDPGNTVLQSDGPTRTDVSTSHDARRDSLAKPDLPPRCAPPATNACPGPANCLQSTAVTAGVLVGTCKSGPNRTLYGRTANALSAGVGIWLEHDASAKRLKGRYLQLAKYNSVTKRYDAAEVEMSTDLADSIETNSSGGTFCGYFVSGSEVKHIEGSIYVSGTASVSCGL
jgi:hypothetical protein